MDGVSSRSLEALRDVTAAIRAMRAPLVLAIVAFFLLSSPAQVLELYLILARSGWELWPQFALALVTLALLSLFITYAGRSLARAADDVELVQGKRTAQTMAFRALPIVLGLLPLLGAALGMWNALGSTQTETSREAIHTIGALLSPADVAQAVQKLSAEGGYGDVNLAELDFKKIHKRLELIMLPGMLNNRDDQMQVTVSIYIGMAICALMGLALVAVYGRAPRLEIFEPTDRAFHPFITYAVGLVFVALTALFACQYLNAGGAPGFDFTQIPRALGALAILNISLISLVYLCSLLTRWSDRHKIPLLAPLLVVAAVISMQNWNDNHAVRLIESTPGELAARRLGDGSSTPLLIEAFDAWFKSRPVEYRKKFEDRPYPIYVVAAQGGGMYAANLSGFTLARLYDLCPAIRHHLFAVSAVSGGSVGAGYLSALLNAEGANAAADTCAFEPPHGGVGPLESKMEALLQADLLAPVTAGLLFPDLLQRFIPYPVAYFDRARAFEASAEEAWMAVAGKERNPLREPFWRHWRTDGSSPMLFLGTTIAENGQQVVIAPVNIRRDKSYNVIDLKSLRESTGLADEFDVPLSTAMSLSARFPLVMPAGLLATPTKRVRLVDGAYFDNSGIEAAELLISQLQASICATAHKVNFSNCVESRPGATGAFAFRSIVLTDFDNQREAYRFDDDPRSSGAGLNEVLSPLRAMMNARLTRGELAVGRLQPFAPDTATVPNRIPSVIILLNHRIYGLPLGWQLSNRVQRLINMQIGEPLLCISKSTGDFKVTLEHIAAIEHGLELVAAEKEGRPPRRRNPAIVSPFIDMLGKLQNNNCGLISALAADGVAPRMEPLPSGAIPAAVDR